MWVRRVSNIGRFEGTEEIHRRSRLLQATPDNTMCSTYADERVTGGDLHDAGEVVADFELVALSRLEVDVVPHCVRRQLCEQRACIG